MIKKYTLDRKIQKRIQENMPREGIQWVNIIRIIFIIFLISSLSFSITSAEEVQNQTIICGVILPLSGNSLSFSTDLMQGIELAADEINSAGGIAGYQIELQIADDMGEPDTALSRFKEMRDEGVKIIIGSASTYLTLPMAEELKNNPDTILLSPQANGDAVYGISPNFYQVLAPVSSLAGFVSDWTSYTAERVAIIYIDDDYGRSLKNHLQKDLDSESVVITGTYPVTGEEPELITFPEDILDAAPDTIIFIVYDERQTPILRELVERGFRGQVVLTEAALIDDLEENASDILSQFSVCTISSLTTLVPGIHTDQFVKTYEEEYGFKPNKNAAGYGYDSLMVTADAIRLGCDGENISVACLQNGLKNTRYYGVSGPKLFNENNAVSPVLDRWVLRNEKFELLTTSLE